MPGGIGALAGDAHPILLLLSSTPYFRVIDVLWPAHSPKQTLYNCLCAAAFYCVLSWWSPLTCVSG
jgi:hypothetical protein